ncbi:MAG: hypothetical protein V1847_01035 [Candidatus Diapherotrites archaeon]
MSRKKKGKAKAKRALRKSLPKPRKKSRVKKFKDLDRELLYRYRPIWLLLGIILLAAALYVWSGELSNALNAQRDFSQPFSWTKTFSDPWANFFGVLGVLFLISYAYPWYKKNIRNFVWDIGILIRLGSESRYHKVRQKPKEVIKYLIESLGILILAAGLYFYLDPEINLIPSPYSYILTLALIIVLLYVHFQKKVK